MLKNKVIETIKKVRPDADDFAGQTDLVTAGVLDSLDIMNIIAALEEDFGIEMEPDDVVAENFESIDAVVALCTKHGKG